jgi:hypothetical protein
MMPNERISLTASALKNPFNLGSTSGVQDERPALFSAFVCRGDVSRSVPSARYAAVITRRAVRVAGTGGEGRFHHVGLGGAVVETVHFHLFLEGSGVAMALCRVSLGEPGDVLGKTPPYQQTRAKGEPIVKLAALAKSLHSLSVFRQGFPILGVQIGS